VVAATLLCHFGLRADEYNKYGEHIVRNFLVNLTMLQEFVHLPDAEGLYYTLAMELVFYFFFSLMFKANIHRKTLLFAWSGTLGLAVIGIGAPVLLHHRLPLAGLFYFLSLLIGTAFYRAMTKEISKASLIRLGVCLFVFTAAEIYCNYTLVTKADVSNRLSSSSVGAAWSTAFLLFCLFFVLRDRTFPRPLKLLGVISYSLYLFHPLVNDTVDLARYGLVVNMSVRIMITIICSTSIYWLIERPSISIGRRVNQRMATTDVAEAAAANLMVAAGQ
jgi:peptidoglycan/LPS O-acetylase OafA/YrhL